MNSDSQRHSYLTLANAVRQRLARIRFADGVRKSHWLVAAAIVATVLAGRIWGEWRSGEWIVAAALLGAWLLLLAVRAFVKLPSTGRALRLFDDRGAWKDRFASAWEFLGKKEPAASEILHLERSAALVEEARRSVPTVFAMPRLGKAWILPSVALAFALLPLGRLRPNPRDLTLTETMQEASREEAENLRRETDRELPAEALSPEEMKELEALRSEVDSVAEALADPEGLTAGEMLEALDEKARAAERLAGKLGASADEWASPEMLAEMANHPDTAQLAVFIGDKAAEAAAGEAGGLSDTLKDSSLTGEVQERLTRATDRISAAAKDEDHVRPVGERFANASRKLLDAQPATAAREFEELSKWFRELAARERAKDQLDELANTLREAGSEIGNSELKKMEQMAGANAPGSPTPQGMKGIDSGNPAQSPQGLPGLALAQQDAPQGQTPVPVPGDGQQPQPGTGESPVPGSTPGEQGSENAKGQGEQAFSAPVPGEKAPEGKSGAGLGQSDQSRDGKGKGGMLSAPIPGMNNGAPVPGSGLAGGDGQSNQSGTGGDQAGTGTAAMNEDQGDALKAASDVKVVAQQGKDGDSTVRAVEGEVKAEKAERTRQEIVADFIAVEEQALDEESLPLSRRRHVLRYFTAIRKQFEKAEGNPKAE